MQMRKNAPEFVRPSIPSPGGVVELSVLDRMTPSNYTAHVLLFQGTPAQAEAYSWLKSSLAESLNTFYPLAGRLRDKSGSGELEIVCNDEGALLQEAWIDCETFESFCLKSDFRPEFDLLAPQVDDSQGSLVLVQITHFDCGRVSLGFRLHHKTLDGISMDHFLRWWATLSRAKAGEGREGSTSNGGPLMAMEAPPEGLNRSLLKPRTPPSPDSEHPEYIVIKQAKHEVPSLEEAQVITAKIFSLTPADIHELRGAAVASSGGDNLAYTRFEILAAFIWRGVTYARNLAPAQDVRLGIAVNGRPRFNPPLPQAFFGNVIFYAIAICNAGKLLANPLSFAAGLVRASIAKVDDAHMRSALDWLSMHEPQATVPAFPDVAISSWTRLGFYEMDFGWGKPSHIRVPEAANFMANLLPSALGPQHVEILLGLDVKQMSRFEDYVNQALKHRLC